MPTPNCNIRVKPAASGCEGLAPTMTSLELLTHDADRSSPETPVSGIEGPGTPGLRSPNSTSANTRDRNSMIQR